MREFELLESENPLLALFNKMFITGRKLKPVVQKRQPVSLEAVKETKILIHIVKGFNVPIRNGAKQDILGVMQGRNNFNMQPQPNPMNPYMGFQGPQPTVNTLPSMLAGNNFGMSQFGGGGTGYNPRASFPGGGMPGQMS